LRNDLIHTKHNPRTRQSTILHTKANSLAKKLSEIYQTKEKEFIGNEFTKAEYLSGDIQYKEAWNIINLLTGRKTKTSSKISGNTPEEKIDRWHTHFQSLLAKDTSSDIYTSYPKVFNNLSFKTVPITKAKFNEAKKFLSMNIALGIDEIAAEVLIIDELEDILLNILEQARRISNTVPSEWLTSIKIPVQKKKTLL
jgi:hypothetical protein